MKIGPLEQHITDYISRAYANYCHVNLDQESPNVLQQTVIRADEGDILLRFGIQSNYLTSYAGLLLPGEADLVDYKEPRLFSAEHYETVALAENRNQIIDPQQGTPADELRKQILLSMWSATESVVESLSSDYQDALRIIAKNSPMKVVTHPDDIPITYKMVDRVEDILDLMVRMERQPSEELVQKLEDHLILVEGSRASIFRYGLIS